MALESVYPDQFFNIPNPVTPNVSIQLRTEINPEADITDSSHWENLTFNPNTYFDNMTLEDGGGAITLKLSMFDQNFANLENKLIRTLVNTRLSNQLVEDPEYSPDPSYFEFYISKASSANLRIRFGYSETNAEEYINVTSKDDEEWQNRTKKIRGETKPVVRSPWLYFQISNMDFNLTQKGLEVDLQAFSIMSSFLNQAKMVETYARLYGEPTFVIEQIMERITTAAANKNEDVQFEIVDVPRGYFSEEEGKEIIEIMLGGEPVVETAEDGSQRMKTRYKSMSSVLNELCSKVRPLKYDAEGNLLEETDTEEEGEETEKQADQIHRYSYYIEETDSATMIYFYYQNPHNACKDQGLIRVYSWLQEGNSIVKNIDIKSKTDFATLNVPMVTINRQDGNITVQVARGRGNENPGSAEMSQEDEFDFSVANMRNVTSAFSDENFRAMFVRHIQEVDESDVSNGLISPAELGRVVTSELLAQLNAQIFSGTIKIPGDPFYLFDKNIQPFMYLIKIIVNRPNYLDEEGNVIIGGKSYMSGYYAIKKITHSIGLSGFETDLEVMKFNSRGSCE